MPLTIGLVALLGWQLLGLSAAAALLLGAALAPTDPVLAGDIGVGPPGDEDEHEPNFALTAEAGLNDGLASPFVLAALFIAERAGRRLGAWSGSPPTSSTRSHGGIAIGAAVGHAAAWSVKRLRGRDLLAPPFDGYHAIATVLVIYGLAEVRRRYGFLGAFAGGLAFRRYEHDHEVNGSVHEGAELDREAAGAGGDPAARLDADGAGLGAPGWEGWLLAALLLVVVRPVACVIALWLAAGPPGEGVRRLVRRARRRLALLRRDASTPACSPARAGPRRVDRDRRRARLDRRPRHHGRAVDAAHAGAPRRRPCSTAAASRLVLVDQVEHRRSSAGWWIGSSPGSIFAATRSSAGRIVSRASNASNTRGSM